MFLSYIIGKGPPLASDSWNLSMLLPLLSMGRVEQAGRPRVGTCLWLICFSL
jgi:hypothetical protein